MTLSCHAQLKSSGLSFRQNQFGWNEINKIIEFLHFNVKCIHTKNETVLESLPLEEEIGYSAQRKDASISCTILRVSCLFTDLQ